MIGLEIFGHVVHVVRSVRKKKRKLYNRYTVCMSSIEYEFIENE